MTSDRSRSSHITVCPRYPVPSHNRSRRLQKIVSPCYRWIETDSSDQIEIRLYGSPAGRANNPYQPLRQNTIESGDEVIGLDTHMDEASDDVEDIIGMDGGKQRDDRSAPPARRSWPFRIPHFPP